MAKQIFEMFMVVGTGRYNHGKVSLSSYPPSDEPNDSFGARLLKKVDIEQDVPEFDLALLEIEALERCVVQERADSLVRVNVLLERISKLKAIGHDGE